MRRLTVVLLAAGLIVWLAAPALSSRPFVPRAVEFEQGLATRAWMRGADGRWRSPVVVAPKRFDLVGLHWSGRSAAAAQIRVRDAAGESWGRWTAMAGDHAGGAGAEPVWAGGADAYQLRLDRRPRGLRARFVNATGSATAADRVRTAMRRAAHATFAALAGSAAQAQIPSPVPTAGSRPAPPIIPREAWGADQCVPRTAPAYGEVQLGVVHHTVNANTYSREDSAAMVLSICRYHRNSNGWRDVGYNFLVDRFGQIFEGRAGGIDQPVIGAQAQGYNGVSTGVANLGTFTGASQSAAGVSATAELLAWKLSLHGVPVEGGVTVTSGGGPTNRHAVGTPVLFERISGHRDADKTTCPGDALFDQLPQIRAQAAQLAPQYAFTAPAPPAGAVSLQTPDSTLDYPQPAQLSGTATDAAGRPLPGAPISVQIATGGRYTTVVRAVTAADGSWAAQFATQYSRSLRAVARLPDGALVSSPTLAVAVAPRLALRAPKRVAALRRFTVRGSVSPRRARLVLEIARKGSDARQHPVARLPVTVRGGRFSAVVRLRRPALHRLRIAFPGDGRNLAARSGDVYLRATRSR